MTNLFYYKILFMLEILVAEWLFTFRLHKRSKYVLRFLLGGAALIGISAIIPVPVNNIWYTTFVLLAEFGLTLPFLYMCYNEPWKNLIFCGVAAYTLQHCAYGFVNLALSLFFRARSPLLDMYDNTSENIFVTKPLEGSFCVLIYLLFYLGLYALVFFAFDLRVRKSENLKIKNYALLLVCAVGLVVDIILNSALMPAREVPFIDTVAESIYNIFCCSLLLYMQYSMVYTKELKGELDIVKSLLSQKESQYAMSKENIDLLNMKCHDMKHQILALGKSSGVPSVALEQMEKQISIYDSIVKTGNDVLDVILTEKSLLCRKNGITLSCIADGEKLNFMGEADLYSVFGNALDNAIEAVMKIPEQNKRIIGLKIHESSGFVAVNLRNACEGEVRFGSDGMPVTDKPDVNYHGFGLKSIAYVTENYGGTLSLGIKDGYFYLNMLFPRTAE